jgi:hypothetical protein
VFRIGLMDDNRFLVQVVLYFDVQNRVVKVLDPAYELLSRKEMYPPQRTGDCTVKPLEMAVESCLRWMEYTYRVHYPTTNTPYCFQVCTRCPSVLPPRYLLYVDCRIF